MKNNVSEELKKVLINFRELSEENQVYIISILLNHMSNGLVNDGNYFDSDEAYENDKLVLEPSLIDLENCNYLATALLMFGALKNKIIINPNGIDIEQYIPEDSKNKCKDVLSKFYRLCFKDKVDFFIETLYDISIIEGIEKYIDFDFNGLIDNLLTYSKNEFGKNGENNLEIEINN